MCRHVVSGRERKGENQQRPGLGDVARAPAWGGRLMSAVGAQGPATVEPAPGATTLCEAFQAVAHRYADQVALRDSDGAVQITFADYAERVRRIAAGLAALGVRRGDTVGLMMSNRPEFHLCDTA